MLFKHPEVLWSLFLLLIPIFIHLFQLRRFTKTPFTNVKVLKKVIAESRKSKSLKKWLLLFTRLLLLTALIFAFAQPFFPGKSALKNSQIIVYLDNSFSMQAADDTGTLLENKVQKLLKSMPAERNFSLFTNDQLFKDIKTDDIKNDLLSLTYTGNQLSLDEVNLKAKSLIRDREDPNNELIVISDFQSHTPTLALDSLKNINLHLVQAQSKDLANASIDTVYVTDVNPESMNLICELISSGIRENLPVSLYNGDKLIAKTSATFNENLKSSVVFTLPSNEPIEGKITISDSGLEYDNYLFFNVSKKEKINVLSVSEVPSPFLSRIFGEDEFNYSEFLLKSLNYGELDSQNLIILNELKQIPTALQNTLQSFIKNGGSLVVIPHLDLDLTNYNVFLRNQLNTSFIPGSTEERKVSVIEFQHPLYQHVFEEKVTNFQYPNLKKHYKLNSNLPKLLSLDNGDPFLVAKNGFYLFTAPISLDNSNFTRSPLVVPTFYNMGWNSLKLPNFYEIIGNKTIVDLPITLDKDKIIKVTASNTEFIPYQQTYANKTTLTFDELPNTAGNFNIGVEGKNIAMISFNHPRNESNLNYLDLNDLSANSVNENLDQLFQQIESDHSIKELWKWFITLALAFIIIEVLIQKYL
ncbi:MAG: BatA domain-containing protein [Arenibacter latericius]|nr:BatA domain-containing protein [Arenibacter latericius]